MDINGYLTPQGYSLLLAQNGVTGSVTVWGHQQQKEMIMK